MYHAGAIGQLRPADFDRVMTAGAPIRQCRAAGTAVDARTVGIAAA